VKSNLTPSKVTQLDQRKRHGSIDCI